MPTTYSEGEDSHSLGLPPFSGYLVQGKKLEEDEIYCPVCRHPGKTFKPADDSKSGVLVAHRYRLFPCRYELPVNPPTDPNLLKVYTAISKALESRETPGEEGPA